MLLILDDIASYFGVKVALYFAWLGHYTCALCVPAVLGTILWGGLYGRGQARILSLSKSKPRLIVSFLQFSSVTDCSRYRTCRIFIV
jgi:hypothetical protein